MVKLHEHGKHICINMLRYSPNCIEKENAELRDKELLG